MLFYVQSIESWLHFGFSILFDTIEGTLIYAQVLLHLLLVYKETITINGLELTQKKHIFL